ncbi:MAG: hypothetical protein FD174_2686 [Geobacteraceae bacterium]|nr:MAG: hypothetical protein FD174_2686 [Geobacteraceae bacterium]
MSASKWVICLVCVVVIFSKSLSCTAEDGSASMANKEEMKAKEQERIHQMYATVTYGNASAPVGGFLLVRNGKDVCAVRFTEFHRGHDAKPSTVFNSGDETLYAEYDWYYQGDGSDDFTKSNVKSGHEKLKRGHMVGIGRFSFQLGTTAIACGPFSLAWIYPNNVAFNLTYSREGDVGNELAPTKWKDIFEIKVREPRLKWYRFDESRKDIFIPVDQLL